MTARDIDRHRELPRMPGEYVTWTPEADAQLTELWAKGDAASAIGAVLGRTKSAVIGRAHRLQLPKRSSPIHERIGRPREMRPVGVVPRAVFHPRSRGVASVQASPRRNLANLAPVIAVNGGAGVSSEFLRPNMCQFPITEDRPHRFCGCAPVTGKPYCEGHMQRTHTAYVPKEDDFHAGSKAA